jgi:hypothetical protein
VAGLEKAGYSVVKRKTSRSILSDWDVTLDEVNSDMDLSIKFQDELIKRKHEDEREAVESPFIWFGERTYSDVFCYTLINLGKDNTYDSWLKEYYNKCLEYNQQYSHVWYLRGGLFPIDHDGVRGSNIHYSRLVDNCMLDLTQQMVHSNKLSLVDYADLDLRLKTIQYQTEAILK